MRGCWELELCSASVHTLRKLSQLFTIVGDEIYHAYVLTPAKHCGLHVLISRLLPDEVENYIYMSKQHYT